MMETFLINAANIQKGGGLQVALSLLEEWKNYSAYRFVVLASPQLAAASHALDDGNVSLIPLAQNPSASISAWRTFLATARRTEAACSPLAVLTIFGPALWRPRAPHLMGFANGLYLFSDSRFIREDWPVSRVARIRYGVRRRVLLNRVRSDADAWWVETEGAKTALASAAQLDTQKINIVPNALQAAFLPYLELPVPPYDTGGFEVLVMGSAYPNKNLEIIPPLLRLLESEPVAFHFTLPGSDFTRILDEVQRPERLHNLGVLHPSDAPAAYQKVSAVFFPSKLETFSAVYLEAMAMQRPILTSDLPFAHAVCRNAARYFDPWNPADAAHAIRDVMHDHELRHQLIRDGWKRLQDFPTAAGRAAHLLALLKNTAAAGSKVAV